MLKTCGRCLETKIVEGEFYPHKQCRGGFDVVCRVCRNAERNAWRVKNKERLAKRRREIYAAENGEKHKVREAVRRERKPFLVKAQNMANGVRQRAKLKGLELAQEFRSRAYMEAWLRQQRSCLCCEVLFSLKANVRSDDSPSLDRFCHEKDYTLENTKMICWKCNNIKRNYTYEELEKVARWMRREAGMMGEKQ